MKVAARASCEADLAVLDQSLRTLKDRLGEVWPRTAVLIATEFGRTAAANGTRGTDHGTGSAAFLLGGAVAGGRVMANWPGLSSAALYQQRDLKPTLDMRSVMKSVLHDHLQIATRAHRRGGIPGQQGGPLPAAIYCAPDDSSGAAVSGSGWCGCVLGTFFFWFGR